jgi:hypothetical protein
MFHLASTAQARLSPEACAVAESFCGALPPYVRRQIRSIRLYGIQARRFDPDAPFELLVLADDRSLEVKTAVSIATFAVESGGLYEARATVATPAELDKPAGQLGRLLQNAQREGIDLWVRDLSLPAQP